MIQKRTGLIWSLFVLALLIGAYTTLQSNVRLQRMGKLNERYSSLNALSSIQLRHIDRINTYSKLEKPLPELAPEVKEIFGGGGFRLNEPPMQSLTPKVMLREATIEITNAPAEAMKEFIRKLESDLNGWILIGLNLDAAGAASQISGQLRVAGLQRSEEL